MPMLNRCCCTKNLRAGVIVSGVWTLVYCVLSLGMTIEAMYGSKNAALLGIREKDVVRVLVMQWTSISTSFLACFSVVLLIVGVLKNKSAMLIPWIVMVAIVTVLDAVSIIESIMTSGFSNILIAILLIWIAITLINIYCELCVLSHYQELKIGRGRLRDYMGDKYRRRYLPEVQHVHIGEMPPPTSTPNQHTVYSFHSQSLYTDETESQQECDKRGIASDRYAKGVMELRPVSSVPAMISNRTGDIVSTKPTNHRSYTGSMELSSSNYASSTRPRRFRTQSDSAMRQPIIHEHCADKPDSPGEDHSGVVEIDCRDNTPLTPNEVTNRDLR